LTASGKAVPIASLKVGDKVQAFDTATGKKTVETVDAVLVNHDTDLYDLTVHTPHGQYTIHTTSNHPIWSPTTHTWINAGELTVGEPLLTADATAATAAGGTTPSDAQGWMWDLTVHSDHDFYIVADGTPILVHNDGSGDSSSDGNDSTVGTIFRDGPYRFQIYANDHGPAHGHLIGPGIGGDGIQIGQNGKPLKANIELTRAQQQVIDDNLGTIRTAIGKRMAAFRQNGC
jgi:hypothetical protein